MNVHPSSPLNKVTSKLPNMQDLMTTEAIVCHPPKDGERQWKLESIRLTPPGKEDVIVEMVSSGICHTDLGCGSLPDGSPGFPVPPYPRVLGHEGTIACYCPRHF